MEGIRKSFSGVQALKGASFSILPGEVHGLVGENGSGKSTLIKIIAGVLQPDAGDLFLDGCEMAAVSPKTSIRKGIQVIYQDFSLFPNLTIAENIALQREVGQGAFWHRKKRVQEVARRGLEWLELDLDLDRRISEIPVAKRQLVAIARALVQEARLVIMDEPTTALTRREVDLLLGAIERLKEARVSVLFVSHKLQEVCEIADRISVLRDGRFVKTYAESPFDPLQIAKAMTGRTPSPGQIRPLDEKTPVLLELKALTRRGSFADVSFILRTGEVLGITGLLGSGQTELAQAIFGLRSVESGEIRLSGEPVEVASVREAIRKGIAYVPEDRLEEGLFLEHSVGENLLVTVIDRLSRPGAILDRPEMERQISLWLDRLSIQTSSHRLPVGWLSGGNQQRVLLARWLAASPRVMILHNPTAGVDVGSKSDVYEILRELAATGAGVILISDDLPELLENCHRILIMRRGRVTSEVRPSATSESDLARHVMKGGDAH